MKIFATAFLKTVQIVLPIIAILALIGLGISLSKAGLSAENWLETILQAIAEFFNSVIIALGNLVLIFAVLEWALPDLREKPKAWDPALLTKISPPDRVSLVEPLTAIILNFAAIVILNFYPQVFGAMFVAGRGWTFTQILSEVFFRYLPVLTMLWALKIILNIILLRQGQWQTGTHWFSLGVQALEVGVASAMLRGPSLIALTAHDLVATGPFPLEAAQTLIKPLNQAVTFALILVIVLGIVEIVKTVIRLLRSKTPVSFVQAK